MGVIRNAIGFFKKIPVSTYQKTAAGVAIFVGGVTAVEKFKKIKQWDEHGEEIIATQARAIADGRVDDLVNSKNLQRDTIANHELAKLVLTMVSEENKAELRELIMKEKFVEASEKLSEYSEVFDDPNLKEALIIFMKRGIKANAINKINMMKKKEV